MRRLSAFALFLVILGGILLAFRDDLLSRLIPGMASTMGIQLKLEGLHLELIPLTLEIKGLQARWRGGMASIKGVKAGISPWSFSLKTLEVEGGEIKAVLSQGGQGGGMPPLPSGLEHLNIHDLGVFLKAPWGEVIVKDARLFLDPQKYSVDGQLFCRGTEWRLGGRLSLAGARGWLKRGGLQGGGRWEGTLSIQGREIKTRLLFPYLLMDLSPFTVRAQEVRLLLPGVLMGEGRLSFCRGRVDVALKGKVSSMYALGSFFVPMPRGLEGGFNYSGDAFWDGTLGYSIKVRQGRLAVEQVGKVRRLELSFSGRLQGNGGRGTLILDSLDLEDLRLPWGREEGWKGHGKVVWKEWGRGEKRIKLSLARGKGRLELGGVFPSDTLEGARLSLAWRGIPGRWLGGWIPGDLPVKVGRGSLGGQIQVGFKGGRWSGEGEVEVRDLSFSTPGGDGAEGIDGCLGLRGEDLLGGPWRVSLDLIQGQALFSSWFLDFGQTPWRFSGFLERKKGGVCLEEGTYQGLAHVSFKGEVCSFVEGRGEVALSGDTASLYSLLVAEPFGMAEPFLGEISPRGDLKGRFRFSWRGAFAMVGKLAWEGEVKTPVLSLEGGVSLPLVYARKGRERGRLDLKGLKVGPLALGPWDTPLVGTPYSLKGLRGWETGLWGGRIKMGPFVVFYRDPLDPRWEIRDLSLEGLVPPYGPLPLVVDGSFQGVKGSKREILFLGSLKVKVAKGVVTVTHLKVLNPFSSLMKVACDIDFYHLDLEDLSRVTPFGKVTGFIKGYVKDLVISHGQPESFRLRVETQEVRGVKKRISLEAINSISILGGGGPVSVFLPFFKSFGYKYLGLYCTLKNDVFTLHGLKKKGKVEYIVEKGGLTGVDVINRNPHNRIEFRDMMERLERIRRGSHGEKG